MKCGHGTDKINTKESSGMKKSRIMKTTVLLLAMVLLMGVFPAGCAGKESGTESSGQGQITESAGQEPATGSAEQEQVKEDGTFQPSLFRAEGGTGKVKITCEEVTVKDGAAEAVIEFSSPHYEWVKKDEVTYEPENAGEEDRKTSRFRIPVLLDEEQAISALTTAMSQPHEVEYTIYVSLTETEGGAAAAGEAAANGAAAGGEAGAGEAAAGQETPEDEFSDEEAYSSGGEGTRAESAIERDGNDAPLLHGLTFRSAMEPEYAESWDLYEYEAQGAEAPYRLIDVHDSALYLLVPEGAEAPADLPKGITVLRRPLQNLYVAATSSMALFDAAGALDLVKLTGTDVKGWYIDAPKKALESGAMRYAGKYSAPDYELLQSSGCDLAVESMMILHTPEVKEKLEELGIPVFIDTSSRESHPMGRTEWIRLYGVLTGHEEEAETFFAAQKEKFAAAENYADTGKSVAFFSISSSGNVIVRAADDYIPKMIGLAGGHYIFEDLVNESGNSASVRLSMEDFYNTAKDADYLIYNATIEKPVGSVRELRGKFALLSEFKAVQDGNVWQVKKSLYQSPDIAAQMIEDVHKMLVQEDGTVFLEKVPE